MKGLLSLLLLLMLCASTAGAFVGVQKQEIVVLGGSTGIVVLPEQGELFLKQGRLLVIPYDDTDDSPLVGVIPHSEGRKLITIDSTIE